MDDTLVVIMRVWCFIILIALHYQICLSIFYWCMQSKKYRRCNNLKLVEAIDSNAIKFIGW
jgi:hypothetical protein